MKVEVKITVDVDKVAELADTAIDAKGVAEAVSDAAISVVKSQIGRYAPAIDAALEDRFGEYATVDFAVVD